MTNNLTPSAQLAYFAANLQFEDIPEAVVRRAEELFLDWFGSALAGKVGRPVQTIESLAYDMGPHAGRAEILILFASISLGSQNAIDGPTVLSMALRPICPSSTLK